MRKFIFLVACICSINAYAQETPSAFVTRFFEELDPCSEPLYCYDYEFDVEETELVITTRLYNYPESPKEKVLIEETVYRIPVRSIKEVNYFPYGGADIYFMTSGLDIEKRRQEQLEYVDLFPIDFNKYLLDESLKKGFENNLTFLIDDLRKR